MYERNQCNYSLCLKFEVYQNPSEVSEHISSLQWNNFRLFNCYFHAIIDNRNKVQKKIVKFFDIDSKLLVLSEYLHIRNVVIID